MALRLGDEAHRILRQRPPKGPSTFMSGWAAVGDSFLAPERLYPVCTTSGDRCQDTSEFKKRGVKVIAISVDPLDSHKGWINDINETQHTT